MSKETPMGTTSKCLLIILPMIVSTPPNIMIKFPILIPVQFERPIAMASSPPTPKFDNNRILAPKVKITMPTENSIHLMINLFFILFPCCKPPTSSLFNFHFIKTTCSFS